ncbi:PLAT domain-containing protein 3-like [Andrographis paniculata]|uniref:PLAT domain-containing protein 3-like n=1 Tax=Andrographis paniculata TaxID=175694 RepID=UPI0021E82057|nr:PLAT domain-containing protein 3-like [Andrographis paniculata]
MAAAAAAAVHVHPLHIVLLLLISFCSAPSPPHTHRKNEVGEYCVYTAYVQTGSIINGGTDSTVILTLYDAYGYGIRINNLAAWGGLNVNYYNYFEPGNLDIFSGQGPCLPATICAMNLTTSDGSDAWYCSYVQVTATGVNRPCTQRLFTVDQWLAADHHTLAAIRNLCS